MHSHFYLVITEKKNNTSLWSYTLIKLVLSFFLQLMAFINFYLYSYKQLKCAKTIIPVHAFFLIQYKNIQACFHS